MDWKILLEPHVLATLISLIGTWGATEYAKRAIRSYTTKGNDWLPRALGLVIGIILGTATWPRDTEVEPVVFGVVVGFAAPLIYKCVVLILRWKWPELAKKVTGSEP